MHESRRHSMRIGSCPIGSYLYITWRRTRGTRCLYFCRKKSQRNLILRSNSCAFIILRDITKRFVSISKSSSGGIQSVSIATCTHLTETRADTKCCEDNTLRGSRTTSTFGYRLDFRIFPESRSRG